nr:uroporphyrinogen decarboxylase family protein [Sporobacter termitidis]
MGDFFRGAVGMLEDQLEYEDEIAAVCDMFADQQIQALQYFQYAPLPVKRVFFPLHKGMDGFISPKQYEKLYWKPLKKVMLALIDMGVTPFIYTEGRYETRLEQLADVPKGKVLYHFETVDMKEAKRILGNVACISGNLPIALMEFGKKAQVVAYCKYLIDTCAPGGGYIFDFSGSLENTKQENLDAMFDTLDTYK